jgi:hypothetical protein
MKLTNEQALLVQFGIIYKALKILIPKRKDYSGDEDPFANLRACENLGVHPIIGCLVRESDKNARISQLIRNAQADIGGRVGESLLDTLADKINYTCIEAGLYAEMNDTFRDDCILLGKGLVTFLEDMGVE